MRPWLALLLAGCTQSPFTDYVQLDRVGGFGDDPSGAVCTVARGARHVHLTLDPIDGECQFLEAEGVSHFDAVPPDELGLDGDDPPPVESAIAAVAAAGSWAVGLDPGRGLAVYDASTDPVSWVGLAQPGDSPLVDVEVASDAAWTLSENGILHRIDLGAFAADPAADPGAWRSSLDLGGGGVDVAVDGSRALVLLAGPGERRLEWVEYAGGLSTITSLTSTDVPAAAVALRDEYAFVTGGGWLLPVDLSGPETLNDSAISLENPASRVVLAGDYLYIPGGWDRPVTVADVSDPTDPWLAAWFSGGSGVYDVAVRDRILYLATGSGGLRVWGPRPEPP